MRTMAPIRVPHHSATAKQYCPVSSCAAERRDHPVGDRPTRQLSLQPVAIGAVVEGQAGPHGVADGPVRPMKSGNADGGKGPWVKATQEAAKDKEIGR